MPDFEEDARRAEARARTDLAPEATVAGYLDTEGSAPKPNIGNEDGPYVNVVGRASTDPTAADPGVPAVETGKGQRLLTDAHGRLVVRTTPAGGAAVTTFTNMPKVGAPEEAVLGFAGAQLMYEATAADLRVAPGTVLYFLVFDQAAAPVLNNEPVMSFAIVSFSDIDFTTEAGPMAFTAGCWIAISSTPTAYTAISSQLFTLVLRLGS